MEQMNIKEELSKHKLLSNYSPNKTLRENVESLNKMDTDIGEQILQGVARQLGKKLIPALDDIVKFATQRGKSPIMVLDNAAQGGKRAVTGGDDLLKMLSKNSIDPANLARVNIGMFKTAGVSDDILKSLASDIVKQKEFIKSYSSLAKSPAKLKAALIQKGYSDAGANALIAEIKGTKGFATSAKTVTNTTTKTGTTAAGNSLKPTIGAIGTIKKNVLTLINGVRNLKWNWLRILKWGAGLGITAAALWWACRKLDLFPEGMPKVQPKEDGTQDDGKTDNGKTDNGNTDNSGGSLVRYSPCTSFPMAYGCKSDEIREVQSCLGFEQKYQTGNFGPITMKGLGGLKELTKEKYDAIIAKCKGTSTITPTVTTTPATGTTITTTGTTSGTTQTTLPPITPPPVPAEPVMDKNKLQELLSSNNLILRRNGKVIIWRGPKLSGPDFFVLSKSLQDKGYTEVRQRETGEKGDEDITMKYKWKKLS